MSSDRILLAIKKSQDLLLFQGNQKGDIYCDSSLKNRLGWSCLDLVFEYRHSILLLNKNGQYASAAALIRIAFEATVRGVWFMFCASEDEVEYFIRKDSIKKHIGDLVNEIGEIEYFSNGYLSRSKVKSWKTLNSLTHSGLHQISRRIKNDEISSNFDGNEIIDGIDAVNCLSFLAMMAMLISAKEGELLENLAAEVMGYFSKSL